MASGDVNPISISQTQLTTSNTTLFTVPSGHQYTVKQVIICNTDSIDRTVTVAKGNSALAQNCFIYKLPIAAYDTVVLDASFVFDDSQTMGALADTASVVNVFVAGWDKEL